MVAANGVGILEMAQLTLVDRNNIVGLHLHEEHLSFSVTV